MHRTFFTLVVCSAVALTAAYVPSATPISASSCDDVQIIFARGSGENLNDEEYRAFRSDITKNIKLTLPKLKYSFYELGSDKQNGYQYPATDLGFLSAITTTISGGTLFKFGESVNQGINELKSYVGRISSSCPQTKFVLGGYSQGAMVVTKSLADLNSNKFIYVANFGDPKLYLPEGEGFFPDACRGVNFSPYRAYVPNCRTSAGYLGAEKPYLPSGWTGKVGLWCNDQDFVCGAGFNLDEPFRTHVKYASDGHIHSAATLIGKKMIDTFPNHLATSANIAKKSISKSGNRDVVYLVDTTGSMWRRFPFEVEEIRRSAKAITDGGGRIALWVFGDLAEVKPEKIVDFTNDFEEFDAALNLETLPKSDGLDPPESAYSAAMAVLNGMDWRNGATKSIVLVTDDSPLSPDRDGTTAEDVIKRSLEIDPVNFYALDLPDEPLRNFERLLSGTAGTHYENFPEDLDDSDIVGRPIISMSLQEYRAKPNEAITYQIVGNTDDFESVSWDLDLNGHYETISDNLSISASYTIPIDSYIQAVVTFRNGMKSSVSAHVLIRDDGPVLPTVKIDSILVDGNDAEVQLSYGGGALGAIISLEGVMLGETRENTLHFSDIIDNTTLSLTPFARNTDVGETVSNEIVTLGRGQVSEPVSTDTIQDGDNGSSDNNTSPQESSTSVVSPEMSRGTMIEQLRRIVEYVIIRAPNSGRK